MKKLVLLGASGSIGTQTIDVVLQHPDLFQITALGVGKNIARLRKILKSVPVNRVSVEREEDAEVLRREYPDIAVFSGDAGMVELVTTTDYDLLVNALVGFVGFVPTYEAICAGHDVALANKETLVCGGAVIAQALQEHHCRLYPIDSEHSAIWQCLQGNRKEQVKRLIITASGGAFRDLSRDALKDVTVAQALAHPNWSMGAKITIDSADMMNKGFEVIEAHWLFHMDFDAISVVMHRESVVHSMVEYQDHSVIAQLGLPDMRLPIQYALAYPERLVLLPDESLDLAEIGTLHFEKPDTERFPLLALAYEAGRKGGNLCTVMNAANEVANAAFRAGKISFTAIEDIVIQTVQEAVYEPVTSVADVVRADAWGKQRAAELVGGDEK